VKPIMNLDEVEFDDIEKNGPYTSSRGQNQRAYRSQEARLQPYGPAARQGSMSVPLPPTAKRRCF
jgi:hypothetical protein